MRGLPPRNAAAQSEEKDNSSTQKPRQPLISTKDVDASSDRQADVGAAPQSSSRRFSLDNGVLASTSDLPFASNVERRAPFIGHRSDSEPSAGVLHRRERSHFSIPDVMVTTSDEDGHETHFEIQLEEGYRRTPFGLVTPTAIATGQAHRPDVAQSMDGNQPDSSPSSSNLGGSGDNTVAIAASAAAAKVFSRKSRAPTVKLLSGKARKETLAYGPSNNGDIEDPGAPSPTLPVQSPSDLASSSFDFSDSENDGGNGGDSKDTSNARSRIVRRLRKSSLPNMFGRRERDAAFSAAAQEMPASPVAQQPTGTSEPVSQRKASDTWAVSNTKAKTAEVKKGRETRRSSREDSKAAFISKADDSHNARTRAESGSPTMTGTLDSSVASPSSPHFAIPQREGSVGGLWESEPQLPSPTPLSAERPRKPSSPILSLFQRNASPCSKDGAGRLSPDKDPVTVSPSASDSKKERKQRRKEETHMIKELERVDKMVRKHDAQAREAARKAEEKERKALNKRAAHEAVRKASGALPSSAELEAARRPYSMQKPGSKPVPAPSSPTVSQMRPPSSAERGPELQQQEAAIPRQNAPKRAVDSAQSCNDEGTEEVGGESRQSTPRPHSFVEPVAFLQGTAALASFRISDAGSEKPPSLSGRAMANVKKPSTSARPLSGDLFESLYRNIDDMELSFVQKYPDQNTPSGPSNPVRTTAGCTSPREAYSAMYPPSPPAASYPPGPREATNKMRSSDSKESSASGSVSGSTGAPTDDAGSIDSSSESSASSALVTPLVTPPYSSSFASQQQQQMHMSPLHGERLSDVDETGVVYPSSGVIKIPAAGAGPDAQPRTAYPAPAAAAAVGSSAPPHTTLPLRKVRIGANPSGFSFPPRV